MFYNLDKTTFQSISTWLKDITDKIPENTYIIIVGNKCDCETKRQVSYNEAQKFCDERQFVYIETSAKNGTNITKLFQTITNALFESQIYPTNKDKTVFLDQPINYDNEKKRGCCKRS
jgi:GTPase SAR1 family protein